MRCMRTHTFCGWLQVQVYVDILSTAAVECSTACRPADTNSEGLGFRVSCWACLSSAANAVGNIYNKNNAFSYRLLHAEGEKNGGSVPLLRMCPIGQRRRTEESLLRGETPQQQQQQTAANCGNCKIATNCSAAAATTAEEANKCLCCCHPTTIHK